MAINPCGPRKIADIFADHDIHLTRQEARFLDILLGRERLVLHQDIMSLLWNKEDGGPLEGHRTLSVFAYRCRRKIRKGGIAWSLENVPRQGYRIRYKR